jgi:ABC-type multidrug transport system ATPase subunit
MHEPLSPIATSNALVTAAGVASRTSASADAQLNGGPHSASVLALTSIRKRWKRNPQVVLEGVDLELHPGASTWVGGRNGVGKTTLLRIAGGLIGPDSGSVSLQGLDPERQRRDFVKRIGYLSAGDRGVYARFSPRRHLEWCARLAFLPRGQRQEHVEKAIDLFELGELADRRADRLSQGQRQRLRLAMTFLHDPIVACLDEPLNSLDDEGAAVLLHAVDALKARGGAVLWCSPPTDQREIKFDHSYLLENGLLRNA